MENFAPGTTLQNGKYRIEAVVGKGGFGITYVGRHTMLQKKVAIKEFFPTQYCGRNSETNMLSTYSASTKETFEKFRRKFIKEAITLSHLTHTNIVSSVDVFEENNTAYYVMDFIEGCSLEDITREGPLGLSEALRITRKIGEALSYIHKNQIMHLDVKPANIMVRRRDTEPILIDFGLAKNYSIDTGSSTNTTSLAISKGYSPIEQYTNEISEFTPKCDIYALGCTAYRMLTGKTPPEPTQMLNDGFPELPANVPASISEPVKKAMAVRSVDRYDSVDDFLVALPKEIDFANSEEIRNPEPTVTTNNNQPDDDECTRIIDQPIATQPIELHESAGSKQSDNGGNNGGGNGGNNAGDVKKPVSKSTDLFNDNLTGNSNDDKPTKKRSYKALIIVLLCLLAGAIAGLIWHFMIYKSEDNDDPVEMATDSPDEVVEVENVTLKDAVGQVFRYTGTMCPYDSLPDGEGKAWFSGTDYSKYEGGFKEGCWHGHGELALRNGDQVVGEFFEGEIVSGAYIEGKSGDYFRGKFHNSSPYEGMWRNSKGEPIDSIHEGNHVPVH